jgi:hypothetical protein
MCVSSIPGLFLISFCCWANFEGILSGMMTGCTMLRAHRGVDTRCSRSLWAGRAWVHLAVEDEGWRIRTQGDWEPLLGDTFLVLPSCAFSQSIFLPGIYYVSFLDWAGISIHQWLAGGLEPGITKNPSWRERLLYARRTHTHTHRHMACWPLTMGRPYPTETNHPAVDCGNCVWTIRGSSYQVRFVPQKQTEFEALFEDSWLCLRLICSYILSWNSPLRNL